MPSSNTSPRRRLVEPNIWTLTETNTTPRYTRHRVSLNHGVFDVEFEESHDGFNWVPAPVDNHFPMRTSTQAHPKYYKNFNHRIESKGLP